ncbi:uncharacterized protein GGS22DRAFT_19834 [Annulohypoxylon maeteangense]|uniref:uncharacterized protein n=1 Tax=Annulohypoxylon maeteangense TaxID=1927788 RepID=UPI0020078DD2|nr:uncharacterized protein GGS22DRAFT_19834 [Annulohypoxylon maeteangense]KAI0884160.1 hypothetical protein GGS22DRAFT_19834 [Annulohypoxylon maeteangense]
MPPKPRIKRPSRQFSPAQRQRRSFARPDPAIGYEVRRLGPFDSSSTANSSNEPTPPEPTKDENDLIPSGYWVTEIKKRLGKCIMFGCSRGQARKIADVLQELTTEWRDLTAASAGFLTAGNSGFVDQKLAFGETASWGYISNANYFRFVESSRVNWLTHFASVDPKHANEWRELMMTRGPSLIMQSFRASYKFPLKFPDTVSAYHKLQTLPTAKDKLLFMNSIVISHKQMRVAAATRETAILYNHNIHQRIAIPPFMLNVFQDIWRQQEETEKRARQRIVELTRSIRKFEKQIWDKEGAVEDMG